MKKFSVNKSTLCVVLFLFTRITASAQTIGGKITDEQNQPVEFANVVLLSQQDSSFVQGTISREDGSFQMAITARQPYILSLIHI